MRGQVYTVAPRNEVEEAGRDTALRLPCPDRGPDSEGPAQPLLAMRVQRRPSPTQAQGPRSQCHRVTMLLNAALAHGLVAWS